MLVAALVFVGGWAPPLAAQERTEDGSESTVPADLVGVVASRATGEPIDGARVSLPELGVNTVTTPDGKFGIRDLAAGPVDVRVQYLGHATNESTLRLEPGRATRVVFLLERDVLEVAEIDVEVRQREDTESQSAFRRRMERRRAGTFITRQDIEERDPQSTSDMLRGLPGVKVSPVEFGQAAVYMRGGNGSLCEPTVFLDGLPAQGFAIDNLQPVAVEGIEVYRRPTDTPTEFKGVGSPGCGTLVIWSQTGRISSSR